MLQFCRCTVATHGSTEAKLIPLPFSSTLEAANMHMPCSTHYTQGLDRANFIGRSKSQGLETGVLKSGTASNLVTAVTLFSLALYPLKDVSAATCQPLGIWNMKHSKHNSVKKKKKTQARNWSTTFLGTPVPMFVKVPAVFILFGIIPNGKPSIFPHLSTIAGKKAINNSPELSHLIWKFKIFLTLF